MLFTRSVNCCDDEDVFDNGSSDGTEGKCPDLCLDVSSEGGSDGRRPDVSKTFPWTWSWSSPPQWPCFC